MDAYLRGMLENLTDEFIEKINGVDEGIRRTQEILDETSYSSETTNTRDLLLGYHIGRMYQHAIFCMPHGDGKSKLWSLEELWVIVQSKVNKLADKIVREMNK